MGTVKPIVDGLHKLVHAHRLSHVELWSILSTGELQNQQRWPGHCASSVGVQKVRDNHLRQRTKPMKFQACEDSGFLTLGRAMFIWTLGGVDSSE